MMSQKDGVKHSRFFKFIFDGGQIIADLFLLQLFFVLFSLKGGIILGFFPSLAAVFKIIIKWFVDKDESFKLFEIFNRTWSQFFKVANLVGATLFGIFGFLFIDLRINETYIQSPVLHTLLLIVILIGAFMTIFSFTIMIGHDLSYKAVMKQSFFISLSVPIYTTAAIIGLLVAFELLRQVVFVALFAGIPLLVLPVAWFTFTGLQKIDELKKEVENK